MLLEIGRGVAAVVLDMNMFAILRHNQPCRQLHLAGSVVVDGLDGGGDEHEAAVVLDNLAERWVVPHLTK